MVLNGTVAAADLEMMQGAANAATHFALAFSAKGACVVVTYSAARLFPRPGWRGGCCRTPLGWCAIVHSVRSRRAQLSSQSMGVLRFGPCDGAITLPSGPIAGSRSGRETLASAAVAPGGGSSPPLRPQPARPSAATRAPITGMRARQRRSARDISARTTTKISAAPFRGLLF